jgi:hypothetical protein
MRRKGPGSGSGALSLAAALTTQAHPEEPVLLDPQILCALCASVVKKDWNDRRDMVDADRLLCVVCVESSLKKEPGPLGPRFDAI